MTLIMPKGDGTLKACLNSLSVYIDNGIGKPINNENFKRKIYDKFDYNLMRGNSQLIIGSRGVYSKYNS